MVTAVEANIAEPIAFSCATFQVRDSWPGGWPSKTCAPSVTKLAICVAVRAVRLSPESNTTFENALTTAVTVNNAGQVSFSNVVFNSGDNLTALTATQIANFVTEGAQVFEGQPPGQESLTWNVAQLNAMGSAIFASTAVTISDTAAHLEAVSDYSIFAAHGVTTISASDNNLSLSVAQFGALGSTIVDPDNNFTLADTAANIEALGADGYGAIAAAGVDVIHTTNGSLSVTFDELSAISATSATFSAGDHVTLTGSQADLFDSQTADFFTSLGTQFHIDEVSVDGGAGSLSIAQWNGLVAGSVTLDPASSITLSDTAAGLSGESARAIAAMNGQIDVWAVSDAAATLNLTVSQLTPWRQPPCR